MKLLAIETSTEACSVAVWMDGEVRERHEIAPRRHTELVLPWCRELLAEAGIAKTDLDAIAVGRGPGAFTGVRLAIALVQGMALGLDIPVLPISTLAVLAVQAEPGRADGASGMRSNAATEALVLAAIDARMGELYLGLFRCAEGGEPVAMGPEWMATPADPGIPGTSLLIGRGTGFGAADAALVAALGDRLLRFDASALPHAAHVAELASRAMTRGESIRADQLEPAYLRNKVALTLAEQATARSQR